ncbi:alkaline-phosphatase-like protein [Gorgonomyces haynaldii]|nr:alkaline-phosphatase-like protein [Gorgonomyces haynaldii]
MILGTVFAALAVFASPSTPEPGQFNRYRALPRGSNLAIVPVDGAEFISQQRFDVSIELHKEVATANSTDYPDLKGLTATVNGKSMQDYFGQQFTTENWVFSFNKDVASRDAGVSTYYAVTRVSLRSVKLDKAGDYQVKLAVGSESVSSIWTVREIGPRLVKNMVLFIGDGMAPSVMNAARYLSLETKFGKFGKNLLAMDRLGSVGTVLTNGIDSMLTDSANSAMTYNSGHKGWAGSLNVYSDTSSATLDDPKVESLAEYIRSYKSDMCVGIVTTAEVQDATPAAVFAHTRSRDEKAIITDQLINGFKYKDLKWDPKPVAAEVYLGGGGAYFCATQVNGTIAKGCRSLNGTDYYAAYKNAGYNVLLSKTELDAYKGNGPVVGIFHSSNMDSWIDRNVYPENLSRNNRSPDGTGKPATDQPGLEQMVETAIKVLSTNPKCKDGFYLMAEAASIDKHLHAMDYDRAVGELLELDRTVKATSEWAKKNGDNTGIIVTADHAHAFDIYGTVDSAYFNSQLDDSTRFPQLTPQQRALQVSKRQSILVGDDAGWPDLVTDEKGLPTKWDNRFRLAQGKVDKTNHKENFQLLKVPDAAGAPMSRALTTVDANLTALYKTSVAVANPKVTSGIDVSPNTAVGATSTSHSLQAVAIHCGGPAAFRNLCATVMDNTEVFFIMAQGLGLGRNSDKISTGPYTPDGPIGPQTPTGPIYASSAPALVPLGIVAALLMAL